MILEAMPYKNRNGKEVTYFYDSTDNNRRIEAGTLLEVSKERAKVLLGDNPLKIKFAREPLIEIVKPEMLLEQMEREELMQYANSLGIKFPQNIKTENLINRIKKYEEKQNS